ncbi:cation diffusion facilitator family transporter [Fodinibacter luteus]|uniref:Cation diffusion facilitator family transporter n=1 Tax=Fodinibacter luteus TaxID=552064 RepID=A0ABP8KQR7_9MICO
MSGGHSHPPPGHAGGRHRWRLAVSFGLVASFFGVELVAGIMSQSLALLSDAGHMAADVVTLGAALLATRIAARPDTTGRRTFGSYRAEIFASGLAVLVMIAVSIYIVIAAIGRMGSTPEVGSTAMFVVGAIGLVINVIALLLLRGGAGESLNVKGAYLEVVADTLGSIGVIVAAVLITVTGEAVWDTVIALAIGAFVLLRALRLGREVLAVLGQHAPAGMVPDTVMEALTAVDGVEEVHDLHLWTLTSGMDVATAHLVVRDESDEVLAQATALLRDQFGIAHATLQVETSDSKHCQGVDW